MGSRGKKKKEAKKQKLRRALNIQLPDFELKGSYMLHSKRDNIMYWLFYIGDYQGCGHYRSLFPIQAINLYQRHPKHKIDVMSAHRIIYDPNFYCFTNIVQIQRWDSPNHLRAMNYLQGIKRKLPRMKIVYDMDDNIYSMPDYNYFIEMGYEKFRGNIEEIMKYSDAIIVSTDNLQKLYSRLNSEVYVVPNYLPRWQWGDATFAYLEGEEKGVMNILWAGSPTHFKDNNPGDFRELIDLIKKTKKKYHWIFMGDMPVELRGLFNVEEIDWTNMLELPLWYKTIAAHVAIAPLVDNAFNRGKSNIKAKEYVAAGFPGIYQDLEPYKMMPNRFSSVSALEKKLGIVYNMDEGKRYDLWMKDLKALRKELWLEENIHERINLYCTLWEKGVKAKTSGNGLY